MGTAAMKVYFYNFVKIMNFTCKNTLCDKKKTSIFFVIFQDKTARLPFKFQVLPNRTGTSFKHVFLDANISLSFLFSCILYCLILLPSIDVKYQSSRIVQTRCNETKSV